MDEPDNPSCHSSAPPELKAPQKYILFVCPHLTDRNIRADPKLIFIFYFVTILRLFSLEIDIIGLKSFHKVYMEESKDFMVTEK